MWGLTPQRASRSSEFLYLLRPPLVVLLVGLIGQFSVVAIPLALAVKPHNSVFPFVAGTS